MSIRELLFPEYEVIENDQMRSVTIRFNTPGSKFGPVVVHLSAIDADGLSNALALSAGVSVDPEVKEPTS